MTSQPSAADQPARSPVTDPRGPVAALRRELLASQLTSWLPEAARRARRATVVLGYADRADDGTVEAALRTLAGRAAEVGRLRLTVVVAVDDDDPGRAQRIGAVAAQLPPGIDVHPVTAGAQRLPALLRAAGAAGAPLATYLDTGAGMVPGHGVLTALTSGRPTEVLITGIGPGGAAAADRDLLTTAGFPLTAAVDLVVADPASTAEGTPTGGTPPVAAWCRFATTAGRRLVAVKNAFWAVDLPGLYYRDPADPGAGAVPVTVGPDPAPLRAALLAHIRTTGGATVTELRGYVAERTIHRAVDADRVLTELLTVGAVRRDPEHGRLAGDVLISPVAAPD
jgi:hypothetical protein